MPVQAVCVCVRERERARARARVRESESERACMRACGWRRGRAAHQHAHVSRLECRHVHARVGGRRTDTPTCHSRVWCLTIGVSAPSYRRKNKKRVLSRHASAAAALARAESAVGPRENRKKRALHVAEVSLRALRALAHTCGPLVAQQFSRACTRRRSRRVVALVACCSTLGVL